MCGIVGYTGRQPCLGVLLEGLQKLEYRGYDSAGIALHESDQVRLVRAVGNLASLRAAVHEAHARGGVTLATREATCGIGHTRWATHGGVSERNAHPHTDPTGCFHIVLNGIIENHAAIRERFGPDTFASDTDAEAVVHLIEHHYDGDLVDAVRRTCAELEGHYAFVAMAVQHPGLLVATRRECPLLVGVRDDGQLIASSTNALTGHARRVIALEDGDVAAVTATTVHIDDRNGNMAIRPIIALPDQTSAASKEGHDTYMLKEIHEQPDAVTATLAAYTQGDALQLAELSGALSRVQSLRRVVIVGCGSSYHAGLVGRHAIEHWAGLPVEIDVASEFRYRMPTLTSDDLVIGLTQSGETADTLAALRQARAGGATVLAVTNVADSQVTREADGVLLTHAGTEVGVAATKSYLVQLIAMYLLALELATIRETISHADQQKLLAQITALPALLRRTVAAADPCARAFAERWAHASFFLYLGRHIGLPAAMEGALKLKEVSYIPAEAHAAGEMKHGPIALLDRDTPVICVSTNSPVLTKLLSNMSEVRAREATVLAIATQGSKQAAEHASKIIYVPSTHWLLQPVLAAVPLQLLAYHVAGARGTNVDQPRNLAKTVTVE